MPKIDLALFFTRALGFSDSQASRLEAAYTKGCFLIGVAGGVGLALTVSKDLVKPMQAAPSKSMALRMMLLGLGVGTAVTATGCAIVKLKIQEFLDQQTDTAQAIGNCKGEIAAKLRQEANTLLRLADNIDALYEKEDERFTRRA